MASNNYEIIKAAILDRKHIKARYNGHERIMCPHAIGHKNGGERALFFQYAGSSSTGPIISDQKQNWRCMFLTDLKDIVVFDGDGEWHTFENHSTQSTCIDVIDVQVEF